MTSAVLKLIFHLLWPSSQAGRRDRMTYQNWPKLQILPVRHKSHVALGLTCTTNKSSWWPILLCKHFEISGARSPPPGAETCRHHWEKSTWEPLQEKKERTKLICCPRYLTGECRSNRPGSSQQCAAIGQEATDTNQNMGNSLDDWFGDSILGDFQNLPGQGPEQPDPPVNVLHKRLD